jgi:type IV fimbrial biogenesis protein FimT
VCTVYLSPEALAKGSMRSRLAGFTLIELLTVLTVIAVLATLALPGFTSLIATTRVKGAATDLYVALIKTRSEALRRNASVTLSPNAGGWQSGWQIVDATAVVLDTHGAVGGVTIANGPANVVYQSSGRIQGNAAPAFLVTAAGSPSVQRCILAATSGRPYVTKPPPC